ncbi:MAG TPA: glutamine--fructose-6-phosphate transaminase (isomerizing) [Thermoanaerobaculia bacterium]|nr:glutamine--fructose-6-phosphate transaminase (isomerizing) [Thermoanaerobaculia bacterium]
MCGIIGYVGPREAVPILLQGLQALEYRGYDSAGVVVASNGSLDRVRAPGKLHNLVEKLEQRSLHGSLGLGHTRWATHGVPNEANAHPHVDARERVAVIHNGIIENFLALKRRLAGEGWRFSSDTDTEVVANLVSSHLERAGSLRQAVAAAVAELEGMYAFAVIAAGAKEPEIVAARKGPPLALGLAAGEQFLGSDPAAMLAHTKDVIFLENGDLARLTAAGVELWDAGGSRVERPVHHLQWDPVQTEKGGYKHFMLKEIHEQPQAVQDTFGGRVLFEANRVELDELGIPPEELARIERLHLVACGTSWHAALVGKFLIEALARLPVEVDYGSEYRYREPIVDERLLAVGVSQSGETADTLAAMEEARGRGARLVTIANVRGSQATRISEGVIYTHAGPEIGVASTKAFTTQLVAFYLLALHLRQARGVAIEPELLAELARLPAAVDQALSGEAHLDELARRFRHARNFLYLGRGINYPVALEGALKLKEISYVHAEGYPAGEMKHGPIALIDQDMPVVAIATGADAIYEKVVSNMQEVKARDGVVLAVTDRDPEELGGLADEVIRVPRTSPLLQPIVNVVPLQLLAYFIGVRLGKDVDQPRNLAKSVTVE